MAAKSIAHILTEDYASSLEGRNGKTVRMKATLGPRIYPTMTKLVGTTIVQE